MKQDETPSKIDDILDNVPDDFKPLSEGGNMKRYTHSEAIQEGNKYICPAFLWIKYADHKAKLDNVYVFINTILNCSTDPLIIKECNEFIKELEGE